jgi:hypothetical protein
MTFALSQLQLPTLLCSSLFLSLISLKLRPANEENDGMRTRRNEHPSGKWLKLSRELLKNIDGLNGNAETISRFAWEPIDRSLSGPPHLSAVLEGIVVDNLTDRPARRRSEAS